jgi:hypothetical protein
MRYTKIALLAFGVGLLLGLVVIVAEIRPLERVASGLMALGIAAIPVGMIADWRRLMNPPPRAPRRRAPPARRRVRQRKPAVPKR